MTKKKGRKPTTGRKTTKRDIFEDLIKLKGRVLTLMRADFKKSPMYAAAKKSSFLGQAMYQCPLCMVMVYTGASDKNYEKLKLEHPKLQRGKESKMFNLDHIKPIVPYDRATKDMSLDELAPRVYCHEDNMQYICKECHKIKSAHESGLRKEERKKRKK
jgi:hypothetical protein